MSVCFVLFVNMATTSVLFILAAAALMIAIGLSGGSLGKSVKWNSMDSVTNWGIDGGVITKLSAYQTLWESYDRSQGIMGEYAPVYAPVPLEFQISWRPKARKLVFATISSGTISLLVLLFGTLSPMINKKPGIMNSFRTVSTILSVCAGGVLVYSLHYYYTHYQLLKSEVFKDPTSMFPEEDNVSVGFYMTSAACAFYFTSSIINIITIAVQNLLKDQNNAVRPISEAIKTTF